MTSETKIALSSALVSGLALSLTLYEAWATRRHNRLNDDVIPIGASIDLVAIKHDTGMPEERARARRAARRLTIQTTYWSMYDESFRADFDGSTIIPAD